MIVAVSVDMEGASQLRSVREIWGCLPEYWETGKRRLESDVFAACQGLLAGGASELVVLDNHGGNTVNVSAEALPPGARLETWRDFDLRDHGVEAMFQVGYHPRGGVEGFLSHTYLPGLRLRVDGELISESHGRAWASGVPLLGITGNDLHQQTIGSLSDTPYWSSRSPMDGVRCSRFGTSAKASRRFVTSPSDACVMPPPRHRFAHRGMGRSRPACRTVTRSSIRWKLRAGLGPAT